MNQPLKLVTHRFFVRSIQTDIRLAAPPQEVWATLTDTPSYPEWNPFMQIEGHLEEDATLKIQLNPPGGRPMSFRPRVVRLTANQELRWLGRLVIPGLFDGEHVFELIPESNSTTRLIQRERFMGVLVPLLWPLLEEPTRKGFQQMNEALKDRLETIS